jgi:hypothetical protein
VFLWNGLLVLIVGIGLGLLMGALGKAGARHRDSLKGSAAVAMYAGKPFRLAVSAWLREPALLRKRPSSWRGTVDLPLSVPGRSRLLILVVQAGNREVELALPRLNAEMIIHGITQAGHSLTAQPARSDTEAPTTPDT